ncbi:hypothetical protein DIS15_12785 [Levilactobacillus brevis]|nr:hypothetical protein DIS15_12785 [Levilactobacillus brevis]
MKQDELINKCIDQYMYAIESSDDALLLNDGPDNATRQLYLDNYPSIIIVLSTFLLLNDGPRG